LTFNTDALNNRAAGVDAQQQMAGANCCRISQSLNDISQLANLPSGPAHLPATMSIVINDGNFIEEFQDSITVCTLGCLVGIPGSQYVVKLRLLTSLANLQHLFMIETGTEGAHK